MTPRFLRAWLACTALLCAPLLRAAIAPKANEDVTVLLFRTEAVQHLQVRSRAALLKLCATCADHHDPVAMDIQLHGNSMVNAAGESIRTLELDGEAELVTGGGHRAEAAGRYRIDADGDRLRVQVQISRERYVEAVLAAEAGPSAPPEFLKAMAVIARSFAAANLLRHPGGSLCDTTHCQALRLEPVPEALRDAAWSTSGETLWFAGRNVPAYFSQHCGGFTEDAAAAWGGPPEPWLTAHVDPWCARVPSSWRASLAEADVRRALAAEGFPIASEIQDMAAIRRDRSGRVQQVRLRTADTTRALPASTLRFALNRSLGWNQLRSDRYEVRRVGDHIVFQGTGLGHGVGLCQAGAAAMAHAGKSYRKILQTYFLGAAVRLHAQDTGWQSVSANGFTLRVTAKDAALEAAAARAFADARSRYGSAVTSAPTLTIFPTTEAYRQATGQPGWELAATRGDRIATQSAGLLRMHGGAEPLLRHEFLHSFVEREASPAAPLWMREGLVGVLNGETCAATASLSADAIDAALRAPASLSQSQQAHAAACALTRKFIAEHGMSAAHTMLHRH